MRIINVIKSKKKNYNENLEGLAKFNKKHKEDLKNSVFAGCYYCCIIFSADSVEEWVSSYSKRGEHHLAVKDCAICPNCGIDSVLPDSKVSLTTEMLKEMCQYWFSYPDEN